MANNNMHEDEDISIKKHSLNDKLSAKYAVLCPVLVSLVLLECELMGVFSVPENHIISMDMLLLVMRAFVSYFSATLLASVAWAVVQQYIFGIWAGLNNEKTIYLLACNLCYGAFYIVYLAQNKPGNYLLWLLTGMTVGIVCVLWYSIDEDVRRCKPRASG